MAAILLLLYLTDIVFAKDPAVSCLIVNLDYIHCVWHGSTNPDVNYTFYSRYDKDFNECARYVLENTTTVGCDHPYKDLHVKRSYMFTTKLVLGSSSFQQDHYLMKKVKLNAPINLTVKKDTDLGLWYYWNYSHTDACVVSQVRHRIEGREWMNASSTFVRSHCINLPSSHCRYELQVRSNIDAGCGASDIWSDWSPSVFWGSMREGNSTGPGVPGMSVLSSVLWALGTSVIFLLLVAMAVRHERLRFLLIPIVPDPGKNLAKIFGDENLEDWLPISKSMKEGFRVNYRERACSVREYSPIAQSASESSEEQSSSEQSSSEQSSGSCASSVTTDQTDCSVSPVVD